MPIFFSESQKTLPVQVAFFRGDFSRRPLPERGLWEAVCVLKGKDRVATAALPRKSGKTVQWEVAVRTAIDFQFATDAEAVVVSVAQKLRDLDLDAQIDISGLKLDTHQAALFVELLSLAAYRFQEFKSSPRLARSWYMVGLGKNFPVEKVRERTESITIVRNLVNRPPSIINPETFEAAIRHALPGLITHAIRGKHLAGRGLNGIWSVGRGSHHAPRLVWVEYRGNFASKAWDWALVGKGVTFDAGGYNLKPTGGMEDMKCDMGGAAAVLGAMRTLARTRAKANIIALFPLAENLISGDAYKPGDVIRMYDGQTVEIANTDAEGRLLLADALAFAQNAYAPKNLVDVATLTGAQLIALGNDIAAVVGPDHPLNRSIQEIGWETFDRCWELPFHKPYFQAYDSKMADFSNGSWGGKYNPGTIQGALFLSQFVKKGRWAHLDIAGPVGSFHASHHPLFGYGATGFGVRLLTELVLRDTEKTPRSTTVKKSKRSQGKA